MLTNFSKWLFYTASYLPIFLFFLVRLLLDKNDINDSAEKILWNLKSNIIPIVILTILIILSILVLYRTHRFSTKERTRKKITENATGEIASFFIPYILSIIVLSVDFYGVISFVLIFILCGIFIIRSDWLRLCPIFFYAGYKLYLDENENYILCRLEKEQINQILLDEINGLEVTPLTPKLFIVTRDNF